MKTSYVLSIDQGTTGSTAMLVAINTEHAANGGTIIGKTTVEFPQHFPTPGWVEHDLEDVWNSVVKAMGGTIAAVKARDTNFKLADIVAIGIANQRETLCVFERGTGKPLRRAIVWQCRRSTEICRQLREEDMSGMVAAKTGLVLDPYFSGSKLRWIMENDPTTAKEIAQGRALIGTIDTYLLYRLTGGRSFATEPSNASRTMLFNIHQGGWDADLLSLFRCPSKDVLAEVKDSAGFFGATQNVPGIPDGVPISGILGDQQAALAGQSCFQVGAAKCTYGTGAFMLTNTGHRVVGSVTGMLSTVAWSIGGKRTYALEGACFIAGAAVQFLRDQMHFINNSAEIESLARESKGAAPELIFVPALAGLGAPHWDPMARGAFLGLTRGTQKCDLALATLEGIALQVRDLVGSMQTDLGENIKLLRVDGGASLNNLLMQRQSDYLQVPVERPVNIDTTAFGAVMFAALGVKIFNDFGDLSEMQKIEKIFSPEMSVAFEKHLEKILSGWRAANDAIKIFGKK